MSEKPGNAGSYTVADTVSSTNLTFASQGVTLTVQANDAIRPGTFLKNSGKNAFSIHSESNGKVLITSSAGVLIMKYGMIFLRKQYRELYFYMRLGGREYTLLRDSRSQDSCPTKEGLR